MYPKGPARLSPIRIPRILQQPRTPELLPTCGIALRCRCAPPSSHLHRRRLQDMRQPHVAVCSSGLAKRGRMSSYRRAQERAAVPQSTKDALTVRSGISTLSRAGKTDSIVSFARPPPRVRICIFSLLCATRAIFMVTGGGVQPPPLSDPALLPPAHAARLPDSEHLRPAEQRRRRGELQPPQQRRQWQRQRGSSSRKSRPAGRLRARRQRRAAARSGVPSCPARRSVLTGVVTTEE